MSTQKQTVAIVGAGIAGLTALKELKENGFDVTVFERRHNAGGVWSWTPDTSITAALLETQICNSKYTLSLCDFPTPKSMSFQPMSQEYGDHVKSYAKHYDLDRHVHYNTTVESVKKVTADGTTRWQLSFSDGSSKQFDKVAWATGQFIKPRAVHFEGQEKFAGSIIHSQSVKKMSDYDGQNVMVVGIGNTAGDISINLVGRAKQVYQSFRRGATIVKRNSGEKDMPFDIDVSTTLNKFLWWLNSAAPSLFAKIGDFAVGDLYKKSWGGLNKPEWGLVDRPSMKHGNFHLVCNDYLIDYFDNGKVKPLRGIKRIIGPHAVEMDDGQVVDDIDTIIACFGYDDDMEMLSDAVTCVPVEGASSRVPPLPELYLGIFPLENPDSVALISNVHPKGPQPPDRQLGALAVAQVWSGKSALPPVPDMRTWCHTHNGWLGEALRRYASHFRGDVQELDWHTRMFKLAGTDYLEHIGWSAKAWKLWWNDRKLYTALAHGPASGYGVRLFGSDKLAPWPGARDALLEAYEETQRVKKEGLKHEKKTV